MQQRTESVLIQLNKYVPYVKNDKQMCALSPLYPLLVIVLQFVLKIHLI